MTVVFLYDFEVCTMGSHYCTSVSHPVLHPSVTLLYIHQSPCYTSISHSVVHPSVTLLYIHQSPCYTSISHSVVDPSVTLLYIHHVRLYGKTSIIHLRTLICVLPDNPNNMYSATIEGRRSGDQYI